MESRCLFFHLHYAHLNLVVTSALGRSLSLGACALEKSWIYSKQQTERQYESQITFLKSA